MIERIARRLAVTSLLAATACLHGTNGRPTRDYNIITEDEIEAAHATDALNVVSRLRGDFLVDRGRVSLSDQSAPRFPVVYVDGVRYGEASILRQIPATQVQTIRLYRAWEAQTKFGAGNPSGVIEVITKR